MTDSSTNFHDLEKLLTDQHDALRRGQLDGISAKIKGMDAVLSGLLNDAPPRDGAELARLRALADTNLALLEAARQGVRSIRQRVSEATRLSSGSQTYDRNGNRRILGAGTPKQDRSY